MKCLGSVFVLTLEPIPKVSDFSRRFVLGVSMFVFRELLLILLLLPWIIPLYPQKQTYKEELGPFLNSIR